MNKRILSAGIVAALLLSACADAKKPARNTITAIQVSYGACFGKCPIHTIKIYNTGLVRYTGVRYTDYQGVYEKKLNKAQMQKLLNEAMENRIDTCKAEYPYVPDLAGLDYVITYNSKTQKIHNAHRGPGFIRELATDIDNAVKVDKTWKKISSKATDSRNP